jgi:phosphoribosylamine--glycine ligase
MARPRACPDRCNVLLIGGGGREHALAWRLKQSERLGDLWLTDSTNAGLQPLGRLCPVRLDVRNPFQMRRWCEREGIDLIVVGPEAPLADGIVDALQTDRCLVFGPTRAGARIEADKAFAKQVMRQASIPTADGRVFSSAEAALQYLSAHDEPCVVKATGLAAGKGVIVCETPAHALAAVDRMMVQRAFGEAGARIIIEEHLSGQEVSVLALVDGRDIWVLDPCQDHKQLLEGDTGPNTGGMGAYCPTPVVDSAELDIIERDIIVPVVDALRRDGVEYRGVLYAGLMLTPAGPKVLEFNCRFGDPECQALMMRLRGDVLELLWATAAGSLDQVDIEFDDRVSCCVVMCAAGYPEAPVKSTPIRGMEEAAAAGGDDVMIFHSGTARGPSGELLTHGGRVLSVAALGATLPEARDRANAVCARIRFEGAHYRRDIGHRVLSRAAGLAPAAT